MVKKIRDPRSEKIHPRIQGVKKHWIPDPEHWVRENSKKRMLGTVFVSIHLATDYFSKWQQQ
jgi:hypothetical protein